MSDETDDGLAALFEELEDVRENSDFVPIEEL